MPIIKWILRFVGLGLLVLFQVLVLNDLNINAYIHPYVFIMFLIILPFDIPHWVYLPLAFCVGLLIDMFSNTPGMHASACLFVALLRPYIIKLMTPVSDYENIESPSIEELGFVWFLIFTFTLVIIHHSVYYLLQVFSEGYLAYALLEALISSIVTTVLITILAFLFTPRKIKH